MSWFDYLFLHYDLPTGQFICSVNTVSVKKICLVSSKVDTVRKQWRRFHRARKHVPPLLQMAGHGGTASRRTANKKLTKLYCSSRKCSPKRLILLLEQKSGGHDKKIFWRFAPDGCPHFQIRSGATVRKAFTTEIKGRISFMMHAVNYTKCN